MIIDQCPFCETQKVQTQVINQDRTHPNSPLSWYMVRCQNQDCSHLVLLTLKDNEGIQSIYPPLSYELDESIKISQEIRDDYREAGLCLSAGCNKASLVMSRRVLQRCLKENGCTKTRLVDAIDEAIEKNILRPQFQAIATEIREYGNLGAHPDDEQLENANQENALQVLNFARLLIQDLYEVPAAADRLRHQRVEPKAEENVE